MHCMMTEGYLYTVLPLILKYFKIWRPLQWVLIVLKLKLKCVRVFFFIFIKENLSFFREDLVSEH